jgi:hypothetical protein
MASVGIRKTSTGRYKVWWRLDDGTQGAKTFDARSLARDCSTSGSTTGGSSGLPAPGAAPRAWRRPKVTRADSMVAFHGSLSSSSAVPPACHKDESAGPSRPIAPVDLRERFSVVTSDGDPVPCVIWRGGLRTHPCTAVLKEHQPSRLGCRPVPSGGTTRQTRGAKQRHMACGQR